MKKGLNITLRAIVDFLPLILHWSIPNKYGLIIGLAISFLLVIMKSLKKNVGLMTKVVFVYFIIVDILYFYLNVGVVFEKRHLISYLVLTGMCFISIFIYRPFTMDASKKAYKSIKDSPLFIEMNIIITGIFGVCYLINSILAFVGSSSLNVVSPILTATAIMLSIILPSFMPEV